MSDTADAKPKFGGGGEKCTGCGKTVYVAEKLVMQGQTWHIECLRCVECNKKLNGSNWGGFVEPDNKAYCHTHLQRLATTGQLPEAKSKWEQNQASGGGSTSSSSSADGAKPRFGGAPTDKCTGCGKTVYMAEKLVMQEQIWHIDCLKCVECNRKLSGANWGGFVPPDNKAYCNVHHMKLVQAQGGATAFSGSPTTWTPTQSSTTSSSSSAKPKFGGGAEETCTGCGKKAYQAEKMKMEGQVWHPKCLRCVECKKMLSGANWGGFLPPDNKPYCKNHWDRMVSAAGGADSFHSQAKWGEKTQGN